MDEKLNKIIDAISKIENESWVKRPNDMYETGINDFDIKISKTRFSIDIIINNTWIELLNKDHQSIAFDLIERLDKHFNKSKQESDFKTIDDLYKSLS